MGIPTPVDPQASKPTAKPEWARNDVANGPGGANNVVAPGASKIDQGWDVGERPAREFMNWFQRFTDQWVDYLEAVADHLDVVSPAINENWSINAGQTTGITIGINPGFAQLWPSATLVSTGTITQLVLTDDATNYIWSTTAGTLTDGTAVPSLTNNNLILLYRIVTVAGAIDWANSDDLRSINKHIPSFAGLSTTGVVPNPGVEDSTFLLDDGTWEVPYPGRNRLANSAITFAIGDNWGLVRHTEATARAWTVPPNSTVAFPVGATIFLMNGVGAGAITITEGAAVEVYGNSNGGGNIVLPSNGNMAMLIKQATDSWACLIVPTALSAPNTAPTYGGHVDSAATAERLPSGWTAVRNATGDYTITHGLALSNALDLAVSCTPSASAGQSQCETDNHTINAFDVFTTVSDLAADLEFMFTAVDISGLV